MTATTAFSGAISALPTPFNDDNELYETEYRKLIDWQLSRGVSGLVPVGTTGESPTLNRDEKLRCIEIAVDAANGRVPVIGGTGDYNTHHTIEFTQSAAKLGISGALVITPYYNKPGQDGLFYHFKAIADANPGLPIVIYNVPSRTNVNIQPETVERLIDVCPTITTIKEASGDLDQILELKRRCGDRLTILSGEDGLIVPYMACGASGVISVVSNVAPEETEKLVTLCENQQYNAARTLQIRIKPFIDALFSETNPIPLKFALERLGFSMGSPRLPLHTMSADKQNGLIKAMRKLSLLND